MSILIFAEQNNGLFKKAAFECASEACRLSVLNGLETSALVIGSGVAGIAPQIAGYGISQIFTCENTMLHDYSAEGYAQVLAELARQQQAKIILIPATILGKDLAPRLAARLNAGLATDITGITYENGRLIITRPAYAGKVIQKLVLKSDIQVMTLRPNVFPAEEKPVTPKVNPFNPEIQPVRIKTLERLTEATKKLELTEADIVVTGGRGMKSPDNWHLITELADLLSAAYGASRAVVDGGWRPHDEQVGQTGKTVSPKLYFAVGISGAIQHVAGMASSKCIVAINNDPEAPIFKIADYGIVGDAMEVLPALIQEIRKIRS